jgi:hypothetical protein
MGNGTNGPGGSLSYQRSSNGMNSRTLFSLPFDAFHPSTSG